MALIHFIFIAILSLESPRLQVHSRSLAETTTESYEEVTTIETTEIPETTSTTTASSTITLDLSR